MKVFYDTEFIETPGSLELISIGMVAEDGDTLYLINEDLHGWALLESPWLMKHVVPHLPLVKVYPVLDDALPSLDWVPGHPDFSRVMKSSAIAHRVSRFLREKSSKNQLWAWYGAFDHVCLAWLFGTMSEMPDHIPYFTNDLRQEWERLGCPAVLPDQKNSEKHHALNDALHLKKMWEALHDFEGEIRGGW